MSIGKNFSTMFPKISGKMTEISIFLSDRAHKASKEINSLLEGIKNFNSNNNNNNATVSNNLLMKNDKEAADFLSGMRDSVAANILTLPEMDEVKAGDFLSVMIGSEAANILSKMDEVKAGDFLSSMRDSEAANILSKMDDASKAADILSKMDAETLANISSKMDAETLANISSEAWKPIIENLEDILEKNDPLEAVKIIKNHEKNDYSHICNNLSPESFAKVITATDGDVSLFKKAHSENIAEAMELMDVKNVVKTLKKFSENKRDKIMEKLSPEKKASIKPKVKRLAERTPIKGGNPSGDWLSDEQRVRLEAKNKEAPVAKERQGRSVADKRPEVFNIRGYENGKQVLPTQEQAGGFGK